MNRVEMLHNPKARISMKDEWLGLHNQDIFDFSMICEYYEVKQKALTLKQIVRFAIIYDIIHGKHY